MCVLDTPLELVGAKVGSIDLDDCFVGACLTSF
jgi:hypothetical protein